jgi:transcriptional regulator with XRE-family HTH domain
MTTEESIRSNVARNIAAARSAASLSQNALGQRLGVQPQMISRWERGEALPTVENLAALCDALEVDAAWIHQDPSLHPVAA